MPDNPVRRRSITTEFQQLLKSRLKTVAFFSRGVLDTDGRILNQAPLTIALVTGVLVRGRNLVPMDVQRRQIVTFIRVLNPQIARPLKEHAPTRQPFIKLDLLVLMQRQMIR